MTRMTRWVVGVFGMLIGLLGSRVGQAQSGAAAVPTLPHFTWQNPLPTGFHVNALSAPADSVAYVVGSRGTLLKTTNAGRTWTALSSGFRRDLNVVSFATPLVGWVAGNTASVDPTHNLWTGRGEVRRTADGGRTWTRQLIGPPTHAVRICGLQALSATEAYLLYEDATLTPSGTMGPLIPRLRHTTNGGTTWTEVTAPAGRTTEGLPYMVSSVLVSTLQFLTPTVGYLAAGWLIKTTDGGQTWANVSPDNRAVYTQCSFADPQRGWLESAGNSLLVTNNLSYTADGGRTWTDRPARVGSIDPPRRLTALAFADTLHGIAYAGPYEALRTTDGGLTWAAEARPPRNIFAQALVMRPSGVGWRLGGNGYLERSAGAGRPWVVSTTSFTTQSFARGPEVFDAVHGWLLGVYDTVLWRTHDRGAHWNRVSLRGAPLLNWVSAPQLFSASFVDRDTGFVFVLDYVQGLPRYSVVRTADGGRTWATTPVPIPANWYGNGGDLRFVTARRGAFVGEQGLILTTQDGGQSWQRPASGTRCRLDQLAWVDSLTAYAVGDSFAICRTGDGGVTWTLHRPPTWGAPFRAASLTMRSPLVGYVSEYAMMVTRDGWQTTQAVRNVDSATMGGNGYEVYSSRSISFQSARAGWLFGGDDYYRTADGGQSWQRLASVSGGRGDAPTYGTAVDRYNAWMAGAQGALLHYSEKFIQADTAATQRRAYCTGDTLTVAFDTTGAFSAAEQAFRLELSNKMGRFRSNETTILPLVGSAAASPLRAILPATLPVGTRYRVRVIRADSTVLGGDNARDLTISPRPAAVAVTPADSVRLCAGDSVQLTAPTGYGQYQWSTGATTAGVWVRAAGSYTVQVAAGGGCFGPASAPVVVRLTPRPAAPTITAAPQASGIVVLTSSAATGNQWFLNGAPITGATGATYAVTTGAQSGSYTVQVTQQGCASALAAAVPVSVLGGAEALAAPTVSVAPNPARGSAAVRVGGGATLMGVSLTDLSGRLVTRLPVSGAEVVVPLGGVPAGTYLLRVALRGGGSVTRRLVVER